MTTIRLSGASLATAAATVRLSGAVLAHGAGGPVSVRLSGAVLGAPAAAVPDGGMWVYVDGQWRPFELWIDVPD